MGEITRILDSEIKDNLDSLLKEKREYLNNQRDKISFHKIQAKFALWDINEIKALALKYGVTLD